MGEASSGYDLRNLVRSLENEGLNIFVKNLQEKRIKESPLLVAAEYGSHMIIKSIVDLMKEGEQNEFNFDNCNGNGENVLHLGMLVWYQHLVFCF